MDFKDLLKQYNLTVTEFSKRFAIPFRTVQNWYLGLRVPSDYLINLIEYKLSIEYKKG